MKIDVRALSKRIGIIFLGFCLLTFVETTISKSMTQKPVAVQQPQALQPSVKARNIPIPTMVTPTPVQSRGPLSLEQIHALSQEQTSTIRGKTTDKFTQTQAHISLPTIKKQIESYYNIKPYQKIIDAIMHREKEYKDDYYVFYHGLDNEWRVPQDLYTRLYFHFKKLPQDLMQQFIFLRFGNVPTQSLVQDFLINKLKEKGLINDHELGDFLYAVNLALFANVGADPECAWQYFMKSRGHKGPDHKTYEKILDTFGLPHTYINQLMALTKLYQTKEQTIIQIFVPQNLIDEIGYLSWIRGNPAHKKTMEMILTSVQNKTFPKTSLALDYYTQQLKGEQEKNPVFKNLVERVRAGDFSLGYFLHFYRNSPELIEGINNYQARLIFTPGVLLNPLSGVKIFRYSTATAEQLKKYNQKFDEIFKKIIKG